MADVKVGAVTVELQVRIPAEQLASLFSPEQVLALLGGIGGAVAAGGTVRDEVHVSAALPPKPAVKKAAPAPTGALCPMPGCGKEAGHLYRHRRQGSAAPAAPVPAEPERQAARVPVDPLKTVVELPAPPPGPTHGPSRLMQHFDRRRGGRS